MPHFGPGLEVFEIPGHTRTHINSASKYAGRALTDPVAVLAALREWKNNF